MASNSPRSSSAQKDNEDKGGRKLWGVLLILFLLVMGIVFAPPFTRDEFANDTQYDQPKVAAKDETDSNPANTGTVLGDTTPGQDTTDGPFYPGYTPPTPTPAVQPAPQANTQPQPTPTPKPVTPPVEEPEVCDLPDLTEDELTALARYELDEQGEPYLTLNVAGEDSAFLTLSTDFCPVTWQAVSETIGWAPVEKPFAPVVMVIDSEQNAGEGKHYGTTLRFSFRFTCDAQPNTTYQFDLAMFGEGNPDPVVQTITVKLVGELPEHCLPEEPCPEPCIPLPPCDDPCDETNEPETPGDVPVPAI